MAQPWQNSVAAAVVAAVVAAAVEFPAVLERPSPTGLAQSMQ
jgi:hypothetical protein